MGTYYFYKCVYFFNKEKKGTHVHLRTFPEIREIPSSVLNRRSCQRNLLWHLRTWGVRGDRNSKASLLLFLIRLWVLCLSILSRAPPSLSFPSSSLLGEKESCTEVPSSSLGTRNTSFILIHLCVSVLSISSFQDKQNKEDTQAPKGKSSKYSFLFPCDL